MVIWKKAASSHTSAIPSTPLPLSKECEPKNVNRVESVACTECPTTTTTTTTTTAAQLLCSVSEYRWQSQLSLSPGGNWNCCCSYACRRRQCPPLQRYCSLPSLLYMIIYPLITPSLVDPLSFPIVIFTSCFPSCFLVFVCVCLSTPRTNNEWHKE